MLNAAENEILERLAKKGGDLSKKAPEKAYILGVQNGMEALKALSDNNRKENHENRNKSPENPQ